MLINHTQERLVALGLAGMAKAFDDQQRQPDDDCRHAEQGERSVTRHARAVHRARPLSDPHRPQRAQDDASDTANPHSDLRS